MRLVLLAMEGSWAPGYFTAGVSVYYPEVVAAGWTQGSLQRIGHTSFGCADETLPVGLRPPLVPRWGTALRVAGDPGVLPLRRDHPRLSFVVAWRRSGSEAF
jgi:hypothetical protein